MNLGIMYEELRERYICITRNVLGLDFRYLEPTCFERDNTPLEEVGLVVVTSGGALQNKDCDAVPLKNGCFVEVGGLFPSQ